MRKPENLILILILSFLSGGVGASDQPVPDHSSARLKMIEKQTNEAKAEHLDITREVEQVRESLNLLRAEVDSVPDLSSDIETMELNLHGLLQELQEKETRLAELELTYIEIQKKLAPKTILVRDAKNPVKVRIPRQFLILKDEFTMRELVLIRQAFDKWGAVIESKVNTPFRFIDLGEQEYDFTASADDIVVVYKSKESEFAEPFFELIPREDFRNLILEEPNPKPIQGFYYYPGRDLPIRVPFGEITRPGNNALDESEAERCFRAYALQAVARWLGFPASENENSIMYQGQKSVKWCSKKWPSTADEQTLSMLLKRYQLWLD